MTKAIADMKSDTEQKDETGAAAQSCLLVQVGLIA